MLSIEISQVVEAPQEKVWALVSAVERHHEFTGYEISEVRQTNVAEPGLDFRWNEKGVLLGKRYECACRVFAWEPPEWFCYGTTNLFHVSYELTPVDQGTEVAYRVELPQTPEIRRDAITEICRHTMRNLKRLLESSR
ncbi:MAG: SRPBCC family protein [Phycisphaerae bacterium]